ncbi:MAG TPA: NADH:flavin oxidoreductase, partial [Nevskiaceae bacterium]|nr:NADH:flavin oxidoreductase [Nevskiaceae bacterium]
MDDRIDAAAFQPLKLGPLALRNRFIKSGTNEGMSRQMLPTAALVKHHRDIAAGGVGMTTVAYCSVSLDGRTFDEQLLLRPEAVPYLRVLTDAVHVEGAAISAQVTHCGCFSLLESLSGKRPMSASGGFNPTSALVGHYFKRAMTEADLEQVAGEFVAGAKVARDAGFDAVELHMGHGYLLSQFLSPKYNRRTDRYGGGPEQRA